MLKGRVPPDTGARENNPHWDMIDAQLTTEIFGLFAPARPDIALRMAELPIRTTARGDAQWASEFYVIMHAMRLMLIRICPPLNSYSGWHGSHVSAFQKIPIPRKCTISSMSEYDKGTPWETVRDSLYQKYQVNQEDGYDITSRDLYCNGCFASGINFAAGLVSLFYGEGDIVETIKIGALAGWDSDNSTATWGGLLGFMLGKRGVEACIRQNLRQYLQYSPHSGWISK